MSQFIFNIRIWPHWRFGLARKGEKPNAWRRLFWRFWVVDSRKYKAMYGLED